MHDFGVDWKFNFLASFVSVFSPPTTIIHFYNINLNNLNDPNNIIYIIIITNI